MATAVEPMSKRHSFLYLDGVRGVAAFIVYASHLVLWFYPAVGTGFANQAQHTWETQLYSSPLNLLWSGNFAVCVFFVLSGFVLSYKYLDTRDSRHIISGAIRRYPRLVIPVAGSIVISYACVKAGWFTNHERVSLMHTPGYVQDFWTNLGSIFDGLIQMVIGLFVHKYQYPQHYNPVLWTMFYEFVGSFLVYGFLALFRQTRARKYAYVVLIIFLINSYLLCFVLGLIIAELHTSIKGKKLFPRKYAGVAVLLVGLFLCSIAYLTPDSPSINVAGHKYFMNAGDVQLAHCVGAGFVIFACIGLRSVHRLGNSRVGVFLGQISFAFYLLHVFFIATVSRRIFFFFHDAHMPYFVNFLIVSAITTAAMIPIAYVYTKYVDEKAIVLSKKMYNRFFVRAAS